MGVRAHVRIPVEIKYGMKSAERRILLWERWIILEILFSNAWQGEIGGHLLSEKVEYNKIYCQHMTESGLNDWQRSSGSCGAHDERDDFEMSTPWTSGTVNRGKTGYGNVHVWLKFKVN